MSTVALPDRFACFHNTVADREHVPGEILAVSSCARFEPEAAGVEVTGSAIDIANITGQKQASPVAAKLQDDLGVNFDRVRGLELDTPQARVGNDDRCNRFRMLAVHPPQHSELNDFVSWPSPLLLHH